MNSREPSMRFIEIVRMAAGSLGGHRLRSFLTTAGVTVGVFSVIGVMTAVSALRGSIESGLSFLGSDVFQFAKYPTGIQAIGNNRAKYRSRRNLTLQQAQRYMQLMEGRADVICPTAYNQGDPIEYNGRQTTPQVLYGGTNEHYLAANKFDIDTGRNFTGADIDFSRPVAILGQAVVQKLFPAESCLGKVVRIGSHSYTVIGAFASKGMSFGRDQDEIAVVPITRFLADNGPQNFSLNIATQVPEQGMYNQTVDRAVTVMRIVRGLRAEDDNDFELYSNDSLLAAFAKVADAASAGALVISGIALIVAGVGIMNIMLVSVTERTREIGIRKSIGARKNSILAQFLLEAVGLSLSGGVAGILLGVAAGDGLAMVMHAAIVFPWGWAAAGLIVCTAVGVGFGLYPALRAASLDPIEALRYE